MPTALSVTAPLLLAVVLVVSAIGKLRAPERARAAFSAMDVPPWLDRPWVHRSHPWGEVALAVLLLVAPGPLGLVVAGVTAALMLGYLALVVRALRSPMDVDCACFGALGGDRVTTGTVWRNVWLASLGGVTVVAALDGSSVLSRLGALDGSGVWWLVAVAAGALTVALVLGTGGGADSEAVAGEVDTYVDEVDYVRSRTPSVPVQLSDGTPTDLRTLSSQRAQLLVFVSEGCASCVPVIEAVPGWRDEMPQLDVRFVVQVGPEVSRLTSTDEPQTLHDLNGHAKHSFGTQATPSAILLGADGLLAGGPVVGSSAVPEFVAEIREQLGS